MKPFRTIARRERARFGRFLTIEEHTVGLPDGRVIPDWPWVTVPDFSVILAFTPDGRAPVFRQCKYGIEGETLAPPGGYLEPGETPGAAARRELREETGCEADRWIELGHWRVDPNRGAGCAHLFLALGARRAGAPVPDDLEPQDLLWLDRVELARALDRGEFKALAWAALVSLGLRRIEGEPPT